MLFLWAPNVLVLDSTAQRLASAWGFACKQLVPWLKTTADGKRPAMGMGNYTRVCTEMLLVCKRGKPMIRDRGVNGIIMGPRQAHSAKPDRSYKLIERLCEGPYLELFARRRYSPAWDVWGNQAPKDGRIEL